MILNEEQKAMLDGAQGETMSKVMQSVIRYGELFGAEKLVPVTSEHNHLVTSFGLKMIGPIYDLMNQLIEAGAVSKQTFSMDPRPVDPNVPANFLQKLIFNKFMYSKQDFYEDQLQKLGLMEKNAFSCACYLDEVGNKPKKGDILSWSESSAVVYANSVLGARCNRNSGIIDIMGSVAGYVPYFGLLTDEGRKASWIIEHAPDYGFFLRYTEENQAITGCAPEPWHYRYVGIPHARLITTLNISFEEYHTYLQQFTWEGKRLLIAEDGSVSETDGLRLPTSGHMVYYVPAAENSSSTKIPVPPEYTYEISGDNMNGFIVTVTLH